jgi:hypothetical protein
MVVEMGIVLRSSVEDGESQLNDELRKIMGSSLLVALASSSSAGSWSVSQNGDQGYLGSGLHGYQQSHRESYGSG